jgi:hypothetical protein
MIWRAALAQSVLRFFDEIMLKTGERGSNERA